MLPGPAATRRRAATTRRRAATTRRRAATTRRRARELGATATLLDAIVPPRCAGCDRSGHLLCGPCAGALRPAPDLGPTPHLGTVVGLLRYRDVAERVVRRAKYRHDERLLHLLGTALGPLLDATLIGPAAPAEPVTLTWVPGTPRHRRERGGDPSATLARAAAAASDSRPTVARLLRRLDDRPQADRDRAGRLAGPQLECTRRPPRRVVVVDDVCTTGASLDAAARALRAAGAVWVAGLALAVRD